MFAFVVCWCSIRDNGVVALSCMMLEEFLLGNAGLSGAKATVQVRVGATLSVLLLCTFQ